MHSKLVWLGVLLIPWVARAAGDAPLDRATLRGIHSVNVIIDVLDPELVKQGLTANSLKEQIERRLDHSGITVDHAAAEFVGIKILQVRAPRGPYALCLSLGVYQPVALSRNKEIRTATDTWTVETILIADSKVLTREALNSVDELLDRLVAAYRAANPNPQP